MSADDTPRNNDLLKLTSDIVAAHLSNNQMPAEEIPALIQQIYKTLANVDGENGGGILSSDRPKPAVPVKKSVTPEYLICLEDGKRLKMLKRHLKTAYNMTPEEYRERWGLPPDYPMVASAYASKRSSLAKGIGLGRRGRKAKK